MLTIPLNNLSSLIGIDPTIIPNIITLMVLIIVLGYTLKSQLNILTIIPIYLVIALILTLLGIESVFNIFDTLSVF